jgi:hypothetical protein
MQPGEESIFDRSTASAPSSAPALPKLYRGRPWLAALGAVLTELVVIGGVDNQGVTKTLRKPLNDPSRVVADYSRGAIDAATAFWWRFAPADGQATHVWAAQFAAIGALVVLTWFGALVVARGSVTFGRVWIGTWGVVGAVTPVAIMVRNVLVTPTAPGPAQSRIGQSVYGFDAFGPVIVAGLVLGLVAGLIAAAVAVSSRRHVAGAAPARGTGEQDEYYDESFAPRYTSPPLYEPRPWGEPQWGAPAQDVTTQLPPYPSEDQPTVATSSWPGAPEPTRQSTAAEPAYGMPPGAQREARTESDAEATQAIPAQPAPPESAQPQSAAPESAPPESTPSESTAAESTAARARADEDALADELAVEEHTQEMPRITDEREQPRN